MDTVLKLFEMPARPHSSRAPRANVLEEQFRFVAEALNLLPNGTVIDGELGALDASRRPNFNLLQNFRSAESQIAYCEFDILIHKNRGRWETASSHG